jgi:hypothetical protein
MKKLILFLSLLVAGFAQSGGAGAIAISMPPPSSGPGSGDVVGPASATNNEVAVFSGTTGKIIKVADGPITVTAGGVDQSITLTPSGTGIVYVPTGINTGAATTIATVQVLANSTSSVGGLFWALRDNGSSNATLNDIIGSYDFAARLNGGPNSIASIRGIYKGATGTERTGALTFNVRNAGTLVGAMTIEKRGNLLHDPSSATADAPWGVSGVLFRQAASTTTDPTSSGTVATAVANSFAAPTFAASSATAFTQTDNLFIAGAVESGSNVTQTNRSALGITGSYTNTAGFTSGISIRPTYNQASGTAANTDFQITRTETAVGSGVQNLIAAGTAALGNQFTVNNRGGVAVSYQSLSGAGAVNVTNYSTELTSTGGAQALTLADGVPGQIKVIVHGVDGGSMVLTPTTKTGFNTITFTNVGESATLQFVTTRGWVIIGLFGAVAA